MSKSKSTHQHMAPKRRKRRGEKKSSEVRANNVGKKQQGSRSARRQKTSGQHAANRRKPKERTGAVKALPPATTSYTSTTGRAGSTYGATGGATSSYSAQNQNRNIARTQASKTSARRGGKRRASAPRHAAPQKKRFPVIRVLLVIILLAGVGVGGFFLVKNIIHPYEGSRVEDGQEVTVVIPDGSTGSDIIQLLLDSGVIHSTKDFRKAVEAQGADQSMRSGTYTFNTGSDPAEIVKQLVAGPNSGQSQLQVPEGLTLAQTAKIVESSLGISAKEFTDQAKADKYVKDYAYLADAGKGSLEGYLYPKTYDFSGKDTTADAIIRSMLDQYSAEVNSLDMDAAKKNLSERYNLNVTDYDILKIASIIEKEATSAEDRNKISSVFYNRLRDGMALESDATMGYETGGAISPEDLTKESPYNTYLHKGLPPTPICSPSLWAIQAAMEPDDTKYKFFFIIESDKYSNHKFSETYEEHDAAYAAALNEKAAAEGAK